jgi:hypothetical protein
MQPGRYYFGSGIYGDPSTRRIGSYSKSVCSSADGLSSEASAVLDELRVVVYPPGRFSSSLNPRLIGLWAEPTSSIPNKTSRVRLSMRVGPGLDSINPD